MCGLAGLLLAQPDWSEAVLRETVTQMALAIRHRGPDDAGAWADAPAGVALGHRRLSILDLSAAGHQPMRSHCGRHVIVFNGEIYNHQALRDELNKAGLSPQWRGHSDTETLLAGIAAWGLQPTLQRSVGMFALAVWDRETRTLQLARDR
ncbi:MAG: asparagine synthetase B, partial [Methylococcus sp.]